MNKIYSETPAAVERERESYTLGSRKNKKIIELNRLII